MLTRRSTMLLATGTLVAAAVGYRLVYPTYAGPVLDAVTAFQQVDAGELILVDIRRPDEWQATGTAKGAHRIDLRRADFVDALTRLAEGDLGLPIALICARGVRSARLANHLTQAGFTRIINIPEGMLGSSEGPGWIAHGLPLAEE